MWEIKYIMHSHHVTICHHSSTPKSWTALFLVLPSRDAGRISGVWKLKNQAKDRNLLKTSCFKRTRGWRNGSLGHFVFFIAKSWWNWGTGSTTLAAGLHRFLLQVLWCTASNAPSTPAECWKALQQLQPLKDHHSALGWTWRVVLRQPSGRTPNVWVSSVWQTQTGEDRTGTIINIFHWHRIVGKVELVFLMNLTSWWVGDFGKLHALFWICSIYECAIWPYLICLVANPWRKKGQLGFEHVRAHPIYKFVLFLWIIHHPTLAWPNCNTSPTWHDWSFWGCS